ncbi:MAG: aryl-sulfate sulfotransferase [Promethearchaeota archaeon]
MKKKLKYSRLLVLFVLLVILTISSVPINKLFNNSLRMMGTTSPTFFNFSPLETNDITPDVSIQVNDSESGLNVESGYFAYTTNGSEPNNFCNPYRDDFNDNVIADHWSFRNQANGSFVESGGNITISDLNGNHTWGGDERSAPFMYQTISGDVVAQVKLSVNFIGGWDIAGLVLCDELDNFFLFQYVLVPFGPGLYNIALWSSLSGQSTRIGVFTIGLVDELWMRIIRNGDEFAGFYSLDGINFDLLGFGEVPLTQLTQVGMFAGDNTSATFDDWEVTPWIECTGINGTTGDETMTVHDVPFNHYSEDENTIKFKISDMNNNTAISSTYTVNITEIKGPANFSDFYPIETKEKNPPVQISVEDNLNGINNYSAYYAFSISGREPVAFMNPYHDSFDDGIIADFWERVNPLNGNLEESISGLNFTDIGIHIWNATTHNAPCLTEDIAGIFEAFVKINPLDLTENKSGGIIAILDGNHAFKVLLENKSGTIFATFYFINATATTLIGELTPSQTNQIWLKMSREGDEWTAQYSIDGDTYATYFTIGSYTFTSWLGALTGQSSYYAIPRAAAKVGLIVEGGASILIKNWDPTPKLDVSGVNGSKSKEIITVNPVYFDVYSETDNKIIFRINSTNNEQSISSVYTVNSTAIYEFRDHTLISDDSTLKIIDGMGNPVWTWNTTINAADIEMLPNGNILAIDYGGAQSADSEIWEINITSNEIVWNLTIVGGHPLNFTHDVDYLGFDENGDETFLIADTSNNRVMECYRNGTIKWGWNATDHYTYGESAEGDPLLEGGWDWTHVNDADRLPDGSTMISLRNFDKVIIVNTTATGDILWEYGEYGNYTLCNHIHNPLYTPQGTIIISDSENQRIIEVNRTTKEIIWEYAPTGDEALSWPRDADLLPNGHMLISDSARMGGNNRIWEIDRETKEVLWYFDTSNANYDADRLDTVLPTINFISPANTTYVSSLEITISLHNDDPWYDEMWYRVYDETDGEWLSAENITYYGPTQMILKNKHTYTLYAWAEDVYMEEGAYPTSRAIIQHASDSIQFTIILSSEYDPAAPFPGNTLISPGLIEVSPEGEVLWSYSPEGKITWDAERLPNGNYLFSICDSIYVDSKVPLVNYLVEMTPDYEVVWNYTITGPAAHNHEIHDVDKLANGNYLIANMNNDSVIEVNSTYDIVWEWKCIDHLPLPDPIPDDWVHLNDVDRLPNGNTLITLRNYDCVIEVNPAGDIVWQYGDLEFDVSSQPENHTKLWGPHNADRLSNGNTMIADSLNHRCIEVDSLGTIVWEINQSHVNLLWPRDCDKLPNGNVLISDSYRYRIIEVNSTYDIVWQYNITGLPYDADRIDITPPTIDVHSPLNIIYDTNTIEVNITSPDLDTDMIWYKFWNVHSSNWVDLTSQGGEIGNQIYENGPDTWDLEDGEYILYVWANDTGYPMLGSDQHINVREVQINFMIGEGIFIVSPDQNQFFGNATFEFEILINLEGTLNTTWYTLGVGQKNITFTGLTGEIKKEEWAKFGNGTVIISFFVNDSVGEEFHTFLYVQKDTIPPITNITYTPYSGTNKVIKSTVFELKSSDIFGSGVDIIKFSIDNITWIEYTGSFNLANYSTGSHTIYYYAIDNVNNTESIKSITVNLVDVKGDDAGPIILFTLVIIISSVAIASGIAFYYLRRRMLGSDEN